MMLSGQQEFTDYIGWLGELLTGQIASLKTILGVENFNLYEPKELKNLQAQETPALVESDPDKLELLFRRYKLSGEDLVWVTVAKIHAYLDLLLITEAISRQPGRAGEEMHRVCLDYFLKPEVSRGPNCLRSDVVQLGELLKRFQYSKYCEKFEKKIMRKRELLEQY